MSVIMQGLRKVDRHDLMIGKNYTLEESSKNLNKCNLIFLKGFLVGLRTLRTLTHMKDTCTVRKNNNKKKTT